MPDPEIPPLEDLVASCHYDPLRFVTLAYPWGEKGGPLEKHEGPDSWQTDFLIEWGDQIRARNFDGSKSVKPIQMTRASGHGVGKGVMSAFIVDFIMSTRKHCHGSVTANTFSQLQTKTWATIQKWTRWCLTRDWFEVWQDKMWMKGYRESWFVEAISCAEENSEAFAGQHAADSTSFYIFDEASNVSDKIFEKADGGLTDGEPMIFVFGNPTRSTGKFYRINFGEERHRWLHRSIDSRECRIPNKETIEEWKQDWGGEDSDRFRVQVRGLPPSASDIQFIPTTLIGGAQRRPIVTLRSDPLICGLDVSRGGMDNCVFRFRRGLDGRSIPAIKIAGSEVRNSTILEAKALDLLKNGVLVPIDPDNPVAGMRRMRIDMMFIDGTGVGGPVCDHIKQMGFEDRVCEIQFAASPPNTQGIQACANMRSYMWESLRVWLQRGAIDKSTDLEGDLTGPMFGYNSKNELVLESKEAIKKRRGTSEYSGSPDEGDALALTFARPVAPLSKSRIEEDLEEEEPEEELLFGYAPQKFTGWG